MHSHSQDNRWASRTKWLTQALIISGALNIGLISTFVYFVLKDKQENLTIGLKPLAIKDPLATNVGILSSYSLLPYQELILRLDNSDLIEEGITKRDLSLACLVAFHHFNLDRALGGLSLQRRTIPFTSNDGQETIDIPIFPGLSDYQFHAIVQYAKTEQWPLTAQGLFYELKRSAHPCDPSLLDAFYLSSEYHSAYTLLTQTGLNLTREQVIDLVIEGGWEILSDLCIKQRISMDLTPDHRRYFLLSYLNCNSAIAAKLLLETDLDFLLKRLSDGQILTLLDLCTERTSSLEKFAKEILGSPRTDTVCKRAASLLYSFSGEHLPEPYDHALSLQRFLPQPELPPSPQIIQITAAIPAPLKPTKKIHTVELGENLWKIARKYSVTIDEIMRANRLESEKLCPGKQLEIPEKKKS